MAGTHPTSCRGSWLWAKQLMQVDYHKQLKMGNFDEAFSEQEIELLPKADSLLPERHP